MKNEPQARWECADDCTHPSHNHRADNIVPFPLHEASDRSAWIYSLIILGAVVAVLLITALSVVG